MNKVVLAMLLSAFCTSTWWGLTHVIHGLLITSALVSTIGIIMWVICETLEVLNNE